MSILSYPERGKWGQSNWPGNCSGHIYRELFSWTRPAVFVDPMAGSMTGVEVASELGIEAYGLDLHAGFNVLKDRIVEAVGKQADLVFSHPPYGGMIVYSGNVWGQAHPDDLSRCASDEDFHDKLQLALLNQREATLDGGHYGMLIGDWRRQGRYTSYQAEIIARMPAEELVGVVIKAQHNTSSSRRSYTNLMLPGISHEYIILWKKRHASLYQVLHTLANLHQARLRSTWKAIIKMAMLRIGGRGSLDEIYAQVFQTVPDRIQENPNWKAKVRQTLQLHRDFASVDRGVWRLA